MGTISSASGLNIEVYFVDNQRPIELGAKFPLEIGDFFLSHRPSSYAL